MWQLFRIIILLGILYWVADYSGMTTTQARQDTKQTQSAEEAKTDNHYLLTPGEAREMNQHFKSMDADTLKFGKTKYPVSLSTGKVLEFEITKTKTGWCPIRHEPLYSVNLVPSKPLMRRR